MAHLIHFCVCCALCVQKWDATELVLHYEGPKVPILISQVPSYLHPLTISTSIQTVSGRSSMRLDSCFFSNSSVCYAVSLCPVYLHQGDADPYLKEQLKSEQFMWNADRAGVPVVYKLEEGYDHSYFFISTFIHSHIEYADKVLRDVITEPNAEKEEDLGEQKAR